MNDKKPIIDTSYAAPKTDAKVLDWLNQKASQERPFLLAFADDGVIWGKWDQSLQFAPADFNGMTAELRGKTLQQAFIFGEKEEVRLFRNPAGEWTAVQIVDAEGQESFDEVQLLWGDNIIKSKGGFVHLRDTVQQGMDHVAPLDLSVEDIENGKAPKLLVRHYIEYVPETGEARVFLSRLVKLGVGVDKKEAIS